jgi:hypothetical protein
VATVVLMRLAAELWLVYMLSVDSLQHIAPEFKRWARDSAEWALDAYFDAVERELESASTSSKIWVCFGIGPAQSET